MHVWCLPPMHVWEKYPILWDETQHVWQLSDFYHKCTCVCGVQTEHMLNLTGRLKISRIHATYKYYLVHTWLCNYIACSTKTPTKTKAKYSS